ncbi:ATP-binding cassette domain-containing protein [Azoarcus sp. KH32C]|uniref:ATP-binding cassette domain-containing protein n=1 Tax=Azoarcus sp. KH32C TaxID=748247 RepID=UPI0002386C9A|nr:ATP-binding cassette domain-containing protein [Azoarcus sp. KH32C]BAL24917.1 putative aliphatic sulfonate family ABC transporter ATP-binding protein [Azoarcus sp. KH32C]
MNINPVEQSILQRTVSSVRGAEVAISGVSKAYGGQTVLDGLNLNIEAGSFVAIVGRSGCGKSTLLRLISGLEQPEAGSVAVGGGGFSGIARDVRFMFQDPRLLPWKRVLANVALGLPAAAQPKAREVLGQVGLASRANEWPAVLSGGQRQRVALARALVHDPALLLLDEPLGALDALTRIEMQQLIETLWQTRNFTALLVTHDVSEAVALADRVILLEHGRVALDLPMDLPRPRVRGSAEFAALEQTILDRVLRTGVL